MNTKALSLDALTGLRLFAAFAVLFVHSLKLGVDIDELGIGFFATNAVACFFVLSGFILTYVYDSQLSWGSIGKFYLARFARIWPVHVACVLLAIIAIRLESGGWVINFGFLAYHLALLQSWFPINNLFSSFNGPSWSVSTELGFYLLFPVLLILGRRKLWTEFLAFLIVFGLLVWICRLPAGPENRSLFLMTYVNPLFRMGDFALGILVGRIFLARRHRAAPKIIWHWLHEFCMVVVLLVGFWGAYQIQIAPGAKSPLDMWMNRGGLCLIPFAYLVWVLSWSQGPAARFLAKPKMVWLGEASYALYLVQGPVLTVLRHYSKGLELNASLIAMLAIAISFSLAALLHTGVELPMRKAILALGTGRFQEFVRCMRTAILEPFRAHVVGWSVFAIGVSLAVFVGEKKSALNAISERAATMAAVGIANGFEPIEFTKEANLLWVQMVESPKELEVTLVWQSLPTRQRGRFVHVCDDRQNILWQPPNETAIFEHNPSGMVLDKFALPKDKLKNAKSIGVGFFDREAKTTPIKSGVRSLNNRRLDIIQKTDKSFQVIKQN